VGSSAGGYTYELYGFHWSILIEFFVLGFTFLVLVLLWVWQRCKSNRSRNRPPLAVQLQDVVQ
jgi:hypothetical protein